MWVKFHDLAVANTLLVVQSLGLAQQLHKSLNIFFLPRECIDAWYFKANTKFSMSSYAALNEIPMPQEQEESP